LSAAERGDPGFPETPQRVDVALAVPLARGRLLVGRRQAGSHLAGLWEFPGGKIASGESPASAARRELREETGLEAERLEPLAIVVHDYREAPLRLHVFLARDPRGEPRPAERWSWLSLEEVRGLEMPEANRQILRALRWRVG
jgi:8-oxo-dGTP diphosphatase